MITATESEDLRRYIAHAPMPEPAEQPTPDEPEIVECTGEVAL